MLPSFASAATTASAARADLVIPQDDPAESPRHRVSVPYSMLGGSGAPETCSLRDVWVFLDIVGQMWMRMPPPQP